MIQDLKAALFARNTWALILPLLVMLLLELGGAPMENLLAYHRSAVEDGQWWRYFTGNFVHFTLHHTVINVAGLAMTGFLLFRDQSLLIWILGLFLLPLAVCGGLHLLDGGLIEYRGFSGALYGMLMLGLLLGRRQQPWLYLTATLLLMGKIAYEQLPSYDENYLMDQIGVPVAVNAHLYGVLGGIAIFAAVFLVNLWKVPQGSRNE